MTFCMFRAYLRKTEPNMLIYPLFSVICFLSSGYLNQK